MSKFFEESNSYAKQAYIVFTRVAKSYNLMNRVMSLGLDAGWRYFALKNLLLNQESNFKVLDLGGGNGQGAAYFSNIIIDKFGINALNNTSFTVSDINENMLIEGKKHINSFLKYNFTEPYFNFKQEDAHHINYQAQAFDFIFMFFSLRNMINPLEVLKNCYKILKNQGQLLIVDFTLNPVKPLSKDFFINKAYKVYSSFIPILGKLLVNDYSSYNYLVNSIKNFYSTKELIEKTKKLGFNLYFYDKLLPICNIYIFNK